MKRLTKVISGAALVGLLVFGGGVLTVPAANPAASSQPPSVAHWLGTAPDGRDMFALCSAAAVHAAREALLTTVLALCLGSTFGLLAASRPGGLFDRCQATLAKLLDSVGPFLLVACLASVAPWLNWMAMAVFISLVAWPNVAAVVRSETLAIAARDYVEAARALGVNPRTIVVTHYLPAMADRLAPLGFALFASFVALFGALGFIGVGVTAQQSLGFLLYDAQSFIRSAPWYWMSCTLAFVVLIAVSAVAVRWAGRRTDTGERLPKEALLP